MSTFLHRVGRWSAVHKITVITIWLAVLVLSGVGAVTLGGSTSEEITIPGQESTTAMHLIDQRFGQSSGAAAKVVFADPAGGAVTDPNIAAKISETVAELGKLDGVASATDPFDATSPTVSSDTKVAYSSVTYSGSSDKVSDEQQTALKDVLAQARDKGLTAEAQGTAMEAPVEVFGVAEIIGVIVALIVLAITYGTLAIAGMNLLLACVGVAVGVLGITITTGYVSLQSTTPILAAMLGLAVGIDYALFIISRFRHELRLGRTVPDAAGMAVGTAGSAVVTAGVTVVIALAGLSVAKLPFLTQMGLAAAGTVVVAVLVAVTLVPAVLGLMGRRVLPQRERAAVEAVPESATRRFAAWGDLVVRRRWAMLAVGVVALVVVALPMTSMRTTLVSMAEPGTTQERAGDLISEHFGTGVSGPLVLLVDGEGASDRATQIATEAAKIADVAMVIPPQVAQDGSAAMVTVIPSSGPESAATETLVHSLRDAFGGDATPKVYVTGTTAVSVDVASTINAALPVYLILVVGLALVLLILVFRSILVPVVGVVGFLLTIGASLGATTAAFQWGWLAPHIGAPTGPIMSLTPIIVVGILFGLAMDYQVFLISRMHEAHARGASNHSALRQGFQHAGPVVVAAAVIMFSVFAGFVPADLASIKTIAFALAAGILFDAFIVRMMIVPAALAIMGEASWALPRWLEWIPAVDVEGAALDRAVAGAATQDEPHTATAPKTD